MPERIVQLQTARCELSALQLDDLEPFARLRTDAQVRRFLGGPVNGLNDLSLTRVVAETQAANVASCQLLERLGMRLERTVERFGAGQAIYRVDNSAIKRD